MTSIARRFAPTAFAAMAFATLTACGNWSDWNRTLKGDYKLEDTTGKFSDNYEPPPVD